MRKYLFLIFLCGLSCTVMSQSKEAASYEESSQKVYDNYLDAPDYIFQCWEKIRKNMKGDSVLIYCDRMENYYKEHPNERKSFKGDVVASTIRFTYRIETRKSEEEILLYFEKALETCKKHHYELSYYKAYSDLIQYYTKQNMMVRAKKAIDEMYAEAEKTNTPYGLFEASKHLGNFYKQRNQKKHAIENLRKAVDYSLMRHNIANAQQCIALSELYTHTNDSSIYYAYKSMERGNGKKDSLSAFIQLATIYGQRNDKEMFVKHYSVAQRLHSQLASSSYNSRMSRIEFYNELLNGNYSKAKTIAESFNNVVEKNNMLIAYANATNDQLLKLQAEVAINHYTDSVIETINEINLAEMQIAYNDRRKAELLKLEYEIQQSQLSEAEKQKELEKVARERAEIELENQRLQNEYFKKQVANDKLEKELGQQQLANLKSQAEVQKLEERRQRMIFMTLIASLALMLVLTITYSIIHNRQAKRERAYGVKLEKMNRELTVANNTQKRFLQNMSHEIRTPLNAICGFSSILADKEVAPQLTQELRDTYAKYVSDNTELMLSLVDDILVMGDIENGKYRKNITTQKVHKIIDSTMASVITRVASRVTLRYDNLLPDGFTIDTDLNRTKQVVLNFLTNACKHTSKGEIVITTSLIDKSGNIIPSDVIGNDPSSPIHDDAMLQIAVTNTGAAIPEDKAEIIFQRFEKLDDFKQGTGLGLPICREIANLFNGRVYLDTKYSGNGNRFVFEQPLHQSAQTA